MTQYWRQIVAGTITAAAVVVFISVGGRALWSAPEPEAAASALEATAPAAHAPASALPVRLRVPAINVDAAVQHVGLGQTGNMAVPSNYTDVGWYRYGPIPGGEGSAVIDGHVDNGLALPGVFYHLSEVRVGDEIFVDAASTTTRFVVTKIASYPEAQVPTDEIFSTTGPARLVLITCDGTWIQGERMYDHRLVVYATKA